MTKAFFGRASVIAAVAATVGCGPAVTNSSPAWPDSAKKWFDRANTSYRTADIDDAEVSVGNALRVLPDEPEVRVLAARIALARLNYDRAIAAPVRGGLDGRELDSRPCLLVLRADRTSRRRAREVGRRSGGARSVGDRGRQARASGHGSQAVPMSGGMVAVTEMPQVASTSLVVPVEVNGEPALGPDRHGHRRSRTRHGWRRRRAAVDQLALRRAHRRARTCRRCPRISRGFRKQLNAPIKMLIGVNLLRHLHPTFDFAGSQFVVRTFEPPPPPQATTVRVSYVRGGGMMLRGAFGADHTGAGRVALDRHVDDVPARPRRRRLEESRRAALEPPRRAERGQSAGGRPAGAAPRSLLRAAGSGRVRRARRRAREGAGRGSRRSGRLGPARERSASRSSTAAARCGSRICRPKRWSPAPPLPDFPDVGDLRRQRLTEDAADERRSRAAAPHEAGQAPESPARNPATEARCTAPKPGSTAPKPRARRRRLPRRSRRRQARHRSRATAPKAGAAGAAVNAGRSSRSTPEASIRRRTVTSTWSSVRLSCFRKWSSRSACIRRRQPLLGAEERLSLSARSLFALPQRRGRLFRGFARSSMGIASARE